MIQLPVGIIRKITLGENPLNEGLAFVVGKPAVSKDSGYMITKILEDGNNYILFGSVRYCVYIRKKGEEEVLWKAFKSVPISIEYELPLNGSHIVSV